MKPTAARLQTHPERPGLDAPWRLASQNRSSIPWNRPRDKSADRGGVRIRTSNRIERAVRPHWAVAMTRHVLRGGSGRVMRSCTSYGELFHAPTADEPAAWKSQISGSR